MTGKGEIQRYINNFRRRFARFLKPGIGLTCTVHPANSGGAILEFVMGAGLENDDHYKDPEPTLGRALSKIEQRAFGGNLDGFTFGGTNLIVENNKVILIKDASPNEWSDQAAKKDVLQLMQSFKRAAS